jgi:DNA-binding response OmpR family regulator
MFAHAKGLKQSAPYDLIVLDMVMDPDFDGLDTFREILALYPELKVIIASGHAENDRSTAALEIGAKWLAKPYNLNSLARAVAELLRPSC